MSHVILFHYLLLILFDDENVDENNVTCQPYGPTSTLIRHPPTQLGMLYLLPVLSISS